jgi:hypothetical protein
VTHEVFAYEYYIFCCLFVCLFVCSCLFVVCVVCFFVCLFVCFFVCFRKPSPRACAEAGNTTSADYRPSMKDKFAMKGWSPAMRRKAACRLVRDIATAGGGCKVTGDVSHVHTQLMPELLAADSRVHLVYHHRADQEAWLASVREIRPSPTFVEVNMLAGWGISSDQAPHNKQNQTTATLGARGPLTQDPRTHINNYPKRKALEPQSALVAQ